MKNLISIIIISFVLIGCSSSKYDNDDYQYKIQTITSSSKNFKFEFNFGYLNDDLFTIRLFINNLSQRSAYLYVDNIKIYNKNKLELKILDAETIASIVSASMIDNPYFDNYGYYKLIKSGTLIDSKISPSTSIAGNITILNYNNLFPLYLVIYIENDEYQFQIFQKRAL